MLPDGAPRHAAPHDGKSPSDGAACCAFRDPSATDRTLRLYAVVRTDLEMSAGKLAAQAGHAFLGAWLHRATTDAPRAAAYAAESPGTKVVLAAATLDHLLQVEYRAQALGIPTVRITDAGHVLPPHFTGAPIVTALGFGPATRSDVSSLTRRLALVP